MEAKSIEKTMIMNYDNLTKKLPYSLEAEQAVLGAVIVDPEAVALAILKMRPEYFYAIKHKQIFECISELYNLSMPIEGLAIIEKMKEKDYYEEANDKDYILTIAEMSSAINSLAYYIDIVCEKAFLREIISICGEVSDQCFENQPIGDVLDLAERKLYNINNSRHNDRMQKLERVVWEELEYLKDLKSDTTGKYEPIKVDISSFDNFLGGLNRSDLILLAARPGVGKTSFALNMAYNVAASSRYTPKKSVVFFSLEMSNSQLARRILSSNLRIESEALRLGKLHDSQWDDIFDFWHDNLSDVSFLMDDTPNVTVLDMKSKLRKVKNLGLVVIDYLQLMNSSKRIDNRVQEISEITRSLKIMAKELDVPVLLLSQLSRSIEQRSKEDKTPRLSDLRDSGSIEQDADIVIFLSRPETFDKETTRKNICDVYIEKNRHGQTGKISLLWDGSHTSFNSISREEVSGG